MKANNSIRTAILLFFLFVIFLTTVGCRKMPSDTEQAMSKKWEDVIVNVDTDIRSLNLKEYTMYPYYISTVPEIQSITIEDANVIEDFLDIVREIDVSFEDFEFDEKGIKEFHTSHIDKQTIQIILFDSDGKEIFGLCLFENGDIDILEAQKATETKKTYRHKYRVYFEGSNSDVFAAIASFCENNFTE